MVLLFVKKIQRFRASSAASTETSRASGVKQGVESTLHVCVRINEQMYVCQKIPVVHNFSLKIPN